MTKDGELHADEDRRRKEEVEVKNHADSMIYSVEKLLKENREKISDGDAKSIEAALEEAKKAVQEGDVSKINSTVEHLTTASHKLAEAMYKQAEPAQSASAAGGAGPEPGASASGGPHSKSKGDGEVIDAEVVDEDKKVN
jgi:molecular chaperone DnaK